MRMDDNWLRNQGGVVPRRTLLQWGNTDSQIRRALDTGDLTRLRRGWYMTPTAEREVADAVRAGGCLGCVSSLRRRGVYTFDQRLHVRVAESDGNCLPRHVVRRSVPGGWSAPATPVDSLADSLLAASRCCSPEDLLVLLDSVVNLGLMRSEQVLRLFAESPVFVRRTVSRMDRAESGTETLVRDRLRHLGLPVQTQVWIAGVGRVDLLVGERLVVEVDSVEHHTSLAAYTNDRRRDRQLRALGFVPIRLTHQQVVYDWLEASMDILSIDRQLRTARRSA